MNLIFRSHAIKRMFERSVRPEDVRHVLTKGKIIREYPDDTPYPSRLILGWVADKPLHVVVAEDAGTKTSIIITVYFYCVKNVQQCQGSKLRTRDTA